MSLRMSERDRLEVAAGMSGVEWHYGTFENPEALRIVKLISQRVRWADRVEGAIEEVLRLREAGELEMDDRAARLLARGLYGDAE